MCDAGFYPTTPSNVVADTFPGQAANSAELNVGREAPSNILQTNNWIIEDYLYCDINYYYSDPLEPTVDICGTQSSPYYDAICEPKLCPAPQSTGGNYCDILSFSLYHHLALL